MPGFNVDGLGGNGPKNSVESARKHRYAITVLEPLQEVRLYAYRCGRPVSEVDRITMHLGQDEIYLPGKNRWLPLQVVFYEPVEAMDLTARYLNQWYAQNMVVVKDSKLQAQSSYKKRCELQLQDGFGQPIWVYKLYDVWPSKVEPSELSYADTELAEIAVTLEIGKAVEEEGDSGRRPNPTGC